MKLLLKRISVFTIILILTISTNISAAPKTNSTFSYLTPFSISNDFFVKKSSTGLSGYDDRLRIGKLGYTTMETCIFPSKGSYYSKLTLNLQQYKKGKWVTIYQFSQNKKGTNGCYKNRFVYKGYKYRLKNNVSVYKSKGGKLITSKTFYSETKKY